MKDCSESISNNPYTQKGGPPELLPSFVCHADILGYSQLSNDAIRNGNGRQFLRRLRGALNKAYDRVRERSKGWGDTTFFAVKVFTDNIIVGYPVRNHEYELGEPELASILGTFAEFQAGLSMEGFFLRGGIAFGDHYMDDDIVFGDALLQAVELDKGGGPPRLAFSSSAVKLIRKQLSSFYTVEYSPHYEMLMEDADGTIFLNYLDEAFSAYPDAGIFFEVIEGHRHTVIDGLEKYRGNPGIRAKYEWAARYHNFVCRDFAKENPIPSSPDADEFLAAAAVEAQKLYDYLIDIESLAAAPSRMTLTPIKVRKY